MTERYAIYFAPARDTALARFGDAWLGRNVETDRALPQPTLATLSAARLSELTEAPRRYGFHGTLKPPFKLADGDDTRRLHASLGRFAARQAAFAVPRLKLKTIGHFLALAPASPVPALDALAALCVETFDDFRAPPEPEELAKRAAAELTPRQAELLARWGYPYVLDEFRFHLTLTGNVTEPAEREALQTALRPLLEPVLAAPVAIDALCLFRQPDRAAPFRLIDRFPFGS
jgi:putative phosphonate metabolism protein